jgi:GTP-binding protein EngB required for normal cell division
MERNILEYVRETKELLATSEILGAQTARAAALQEKLEDQSITVSVIGQFKRGKSCLVNALLGEDILPTGIVPITSAATKIRYGQPSCSVRFFNGVVKQVDEAELPHYINEQENPGNLLGVDCVDMTTLSDFLKDGLTFVDTPGIGSYHKNNTDAAYAFIKESDAVIFMLSVDSPINEIEIDILRNTKEYAAKFFFAVNKIDTIGASDRAAYVSYCRSLLAMLMDTDEVVLYPISALTGEGLDALKEALNVGLRAKVREILEESARLKLKDICGSALSQVELYWKVLLMPPVQLKGCLTDFKAYLASLPEETGRTVHELEADRDIIIPGLEETLKVKLNEYKMALSEQVTEVFGMDYHYELPELREEAAGEGGHGGWRLASELGDEYLAETRRLAEELERTIDDVLMYRNNDTVAVVNRIYSLNKLTRTLKRIRRILEGTEEENPGPSTHAIKMTNLCP